MKEIFKSLRTRLKEVPGINHIDMDKGQLDHYELRPSVAFPCILIDLQRPRSEDRDQRGTQQTSAVMINIRIGFDFTGETSSHTPDEKLDTSLAYYDMVELVYKKLQGWKDTGFTILSNKGERTERRPDRYKVVNLPFGSQTIKTNS